MNLYNNIESWLSARQNHLVHRQLLIISGPELWAIDQARAICPPQDCLWLGNSASNAPLVTNAQYQTFLGQEFDALVINCFSGFKANAVLALSGTIKAGGLMIMICPGFESWPTFVDPQWQNRISYGFIDTTQRSYFIERLLVAVKQDNNIAQLTSTGFTGQLSLVNQLETDPKGKSTNKSSQAEAIDAIIKVATGHRNRPLVISADRGRGKSSALGLAAAQLIKSAHKKILIVAPSPAMVEQVFKHARQSLPTATVSKNKLNTDSGYLHYVAPDAILDIQDDADLLLIDEAAALPTNLLFSLLNRFSRIVFCTTLHGYEGSGRGFELRVKQQLTQTKPGWRQIHLTQPIRWYQGDSLEQFWFELFCIKGKPALTRSHHDSTDADTISCCNVTQSTLVDEPSLAYEVFQLLIDAHYQTSPDDFIRLFDAPEQRCYVMKQGQRIVGVALIIEEGGKLLAPLSEDIAAGKRRLKGHLIAQNVAFHYAMPEFCALPQWRITRLAIAADYQQQGLGTKLLSYITEQAKLHKQALLTSAFGATVDLMRFWLQAGFKLVNVSKKPEISSGEHSVQLLLPLSQQANTLTQAISTEFAKELIFQSDKALNNIKPELLHLALVQCPVALNPAWSHHHIIKQFICGTRPLQLSQRHLRDHYLIHIAKFKALDTRHIVMVVSLLMQQRSNAWLAQTLGLNGAKAIEREMREVFAKILDTQSEPG